MYLNCGRGDFMSRSLPATRSDVAWQIIRPISVWALQAQRRYLHEEHVSVISQTIGFFHLTDTGTNG